MKRNFIYTLIITYALIPAIAKSQSGEVKTVQPKIFVIPFTKEGEDIRTVFEADGNKRIAVAKVKEAFDNRNFTTYDFVQALKNVEKKDVLTQESPQDFKDRIIAMSLADIWVEVDVLPMERTGAGDKVTVILNAYDAATGRGFGTVTCESRYVKGGVDVGKLIDNALNHSNEKESKSGVETFLNTMQSKFDDIVANGRPVVVDLRFAAGSSWGLDSEVGDDLFFDFLNNWFEDFAVKGQASGEPASKTASWEVRIPMKDETGKNYSPAKFRLAIIKFLKSKNIGCDAIVDKGNIIITIK